MRQVLLGYTMYSTRKRKNRFESCRLFGFAIVERISELFVESNCWNGPPPPVVYVVSNSGQSQVTNYAGLRVLIALPFDVGLAAPSSSCPSFLLHPPTPSTHTHTLPTTLRASSIGCDRSLVPWNDGCRLIYGSSMFQIQLLLLQSNSLLRDTCRKRISSSSLPPLF